MERRKNRECAVLGMAATLIGGASHAAPQQALNKSVTIAFSVTVPSRGSDGSTQANPRAITRTYYISSQGRVFARADRRVGSKLQDRVEKGPGETNMRFSGNSMVGVLVAGKELNATVDEIKAAIKAPLDNVNTINQVIAEAETGFKQIAMQLH